MPAVPRARNLSLSIAGILLAAASVTHSAVFQSDHPGADLAPVGNAAGMIEILQGNGTILWTSLAGPVHTIRVEGWPIVVDESQLGGALVIQRATDATAGVVDFGERPRSLRFDSSGG